MTAISDENGDIAEKYRYSVYGDVEIAKANGETRPASIIDNPYYFTGRLLDTETGLYYYRARMYSATIGRFLQTDPIGYADGINWYAYCANNPLGFVDPFGLCGDSSWYSRIGSGISGAAGWVGSGIARGAGSAYSSVSNAAGRAAAYVKSELEYKYAPLVGLGPEGYSAGDAWGDFAIGYSKASQGAVNAFTGGLFDTESGIFYESFNRQWESLGYEGNQGDPSFASGETGGRTAEALLLAAAGCKAAGFDPWLGSAGIHPPHHGMGKHFELIVRVGQSRNLKVIVPGAERLVYFGIH